MANHKSAMKRDRQSKVRRLRNRKNKSTMKTAIRQVEEALVAGLEDEAQAALAHAVPVIQKTAAKGTIHTASMAFFLYCSPLKSSCLISF